MQTIKPVTKPSKQRKMLFQAPGHIRHKLFAAPLSSELKTTHGTRSLPVRSGDTVRVMRGDNKGFEGKVTSIDRRKYRVYVEGLTREKVDGTTRFIPTHPSKVMITHLNLDDKWRKRILERKKGVPRKIETVEAKPPEEKVAEAEVAEERVPKEKPRKKREVAAKKPSARKAKEKAEEVTEEPKQKAKKSRAKRKIVKETGEGM